MSVKNFKRTGYGLPSPLINQAPLPIISQRAPTTRDKAEIGTLWVDVPNQDVYVLVSTTANTATWINAGGGTGTFANLNVTNTVGFINGPVVMPFLTGGVVQASALGVISSSAGTNGQLLVGATGGLPAWANITAGAGIGIVTGANTITISAPGGTAVQYTTDDTLTEVPDGTGNVNINGVAGNIVTSRVGANTIGISLDGSPTITGILTITTNGMDIQAGTTTITSDTNAGQAIYLHANAGANETIQIHSDQGTTGNSVLLLSDVGGINIQSGLGAVGAVTINAAHAAGGVNIDAGTNGINVQAANGPVAITSGTGTMSVGADATVHATTLGSATGASATTIQAGTGNLIQTSTGTLTLDAAGVLELNSSAGIISIGNDAVAQNINIGTGAAQRIITIGNATGTSSTVINVGTGNLDLGVTATAHTTRLGSTTGASATTVQAGTGNLIVNGGGDLTIDSVGVLELNSSAGVISIGNDAVAQNMNIGTGAAARIITIGNATGASSTVIDVGTGNLDLGVTATAHTTRLGSTTGASATTIQAGTGATTITAGGIFDVNATGAVTIDSTGGTIGIGAGADANNISIGTGAAARAITIGNVTGATAVTIDCGTGGVMIGNSATAHNTYVGSLNTTSTTDIYSGTGGILLNGNGAGLLEATPATASFAGTAVTINANLGVATFTGLTTAAGAEETLTINNTVATATSAVLVTVANKGANDAQMSLDRVIPAANSITLIVSNYGAAALNGDIIVTFWIVAP